MTDGTIAIQGAGSWFRADITSTLAAMHEAEALLAHRRELHAIRADANALAAALRMAHSAVHRAEPCDEVMHDQVTAALAAHDALTSKP